VRLAKSFISNMTFSYFYFVLLKKQKRYLKKVI